MQKKKKKKSDSDHSLYSVSSAELAQKVVQVKFGQIQIHLNEVFVGVFFTIVRLPIYMMLYAKQNQYYALYLDISCLISSLVETIWRKNQSFIYWKNMKNVSLCSPVFLCTRQRAKLRREVTLPMKNIKKKKTTKKKKKQNKKKKR